MAAGDLRYHNMVASNFSIARSFSASDQCGLPPPPVMTSMSGRGDLRVKCKIKSGRRSRSAPIAEGALRRVDELYYVEPRSAARGVGSERKGELAAPRPLDA